MSKFTNEGSVLRKNKKRNKIREERMDWEIRKGWQENEKKNTVTKKISLY